MNQLSSFPVQKIVRLLSQYRVVLSALIILGLFGYTLIRMLDISDPNIDSSYQNSQREEIETATIRIDDELRERIESLQDTPVNDQPSNLGTNDPFNP